MKIYLDNCSLQRPLDSRTQTRIALEAEAVIGILEQVQMGRVTLVSSEALLFRIQRNPFEIRKEYALTVLESADLVVASDDSVKNRAREFEVAGIKPLDAAHLALAEKAEVDYFCTCDDRLLRRAKTIISLKINVASPIELIKELQI